MKIYQQIIIRTLFGVSLAGLLGGCTMLRDDMAKTSTEYNLIVEKVQNEMLLLNIVRASKRRPMYFTSFSKLTGNLNYEFQTSGNIPFGRIGAGINSAYYVSPSVKYSNSPLFDLAVLDSKEFTCGIMSPVPMTTIEYYWQQGWPKEVLLYLFIHRIEIKDVNGTTVEYKNYPIDRIEFDKFQKFILGTKWNIAEVNIPDIPIGHVDANDAMKLDRLVEMKKAGLKLRPGKDKNKKELCPSKTTEFAFECKDINDTKAESRIFSSGDKDNKIYIRSPQAILYYLGEIVRVENRAKDPNTPKLYLRGPHPARLFYARNVTANEPDCKTPCVTVDYERNRYVIPQAPDDDRGYATDFSMQVLSLVSQLIGLQKTGEQAPVTNVVSVVGR